MLLDEETEDNLNFLLKVSDKTLYDWSSKMDFEDLDYAKELLKYHIRFIENRIDIINIERKMKQCEMIQHYSYAETILNQIAGKTK